MMKKNSVIILSTTILLLGLNCNNDQPVSVNQTYESLGKTSLASASQQSGCVTPPAGLVAWWPSEGNTNDIINSNNGTILNGVTYATGKVGTAFAFNGVNSHIVVPDNPTLLINNTITIEAWIYLNVTGKWQYIIIKDSETSHGEFHTFQMCVTDMNRIGFYLGDGTNPYWGLESTNLLAAGQWYHVAGVYDGSVQGIFINGALDAINVIGSHTLYNHNKPIRIGICYEQAYYHPFDGMIDELSLYNQALTAQDIQSIYNAGSAGKCKGPNYRLPFIGPYNITNGPGCSNHIGRQGEAIDFGLSNNTSIYATEDGEVIEAEQGIDPVEYYYGKHIKIRHSNKDVSYYCHLSSLQVTNGQQVSKGQLIGFSGRSGIPTRSVVRSQFRGTVTRVVQPSFRNGHLIPGNIQIRNIRTHQNTNYNQIQQIFVNVGDNVAANQIIGGTAIFPIHLHFEIRNSNGNGVPIYDLDTLNWTAKSADGRPICQPSGTIDGTAIGPAI